MPFAEQNGRQKDNKYAFSFCTENNIVGNNNMQTIGNNNNIATTLKIDSQYDELFELLKNYATPKMLKDLKETLLKIKKAIDG